MKRALITGVTGQDGSYLAELLLEKHYEVWGLVRRSASHNTSRVDHLLQGENASAFHLVFGDLTDGSRLTSLLQEIEPHEVYNLGAQSHVGISFDCPVYTVDANATGTLRLFDAVRHMKTPARVYQASSSEMYGKVVETPQTEKTPFYPRSPYGCSKVFGFWQAVNYREAYGMFISNGILFNHESPRRGETFVTRKITRAATRIKLGLQEKLFLGNLESKRDWGFARDYVEAMWLMLQHETPDDFVVATGETHTVREFLDEVFGTLDLDWHDHVEIDPQFFRPTEVDLLLGDSTKARQVLNWEPKVSFRELAQMMTEADMTLAQAELAVQSAEARRSRAASQEVSKRRLAA